MVSVAQQQESRERADEFVVEPRTRVDTLHFSVLETGHQGAGVCGYSREGLDLGSYGLRENTVFLHGSSREKLREVIDSIKRVRRP